MTIDASLSRTAAELETLKQDTVELRQELAELQRANARLASMLYQQKASIQGLLARITPSAGVETRPSPAPQELKKAA